ncbi:MAG: hypothetical protein AMXMBFR46_06410 [Acidimicrobiia bacterium]
MDSARAFTVADDGYFLGTVALVNSLRITGNDLPVTVLDVGLRDWQRELLEAECEVTSPAEDVGLPQVSKAWAPARSDAEVVVLIDSDVIVTQPLHDVVACARAGFVHAYRDGPVADRWFVEWAEIFALRAPLRRQPYVNSGFLAFSPRHHPHLLARWTDACARLRGRPVLAETVPDDPVWLVDQDALNALLMSEWDASRLVQAPAPEMVLTGEMPAARVVDRRRLVCRTPAGPARMLHAVGTVKPWQPRARWEYRSSVYTACLTRLLLADDVTIRVPAGAVPRRLHLGWGGWITARALQAYEAPARWTRPVRRRVGLSPLRG